MIDIYYEEKGKVKSAKAGSLKSLKGKKMWLDITGMTEKENKLIQEIFELHALTAEDLFDTNNSRIKLEEFPEYLFCVFYGIQKEKSIKLNEIDFIIGKNFLITNHKKAVDSFETLKKKTEKLDMLFSKGLDFVFHKLLDLEIDNYYPILEMIDDQIEAIEDEVTKKVRPGSLSRILSLKRKIISIKRVVIPQREKISMLTKGDRKFISKKSVPYFRDIYDHSIRVADTVDNYREAVGSTFDAYMSAVSNNMNEVMKILSIIATIALPLVVVSGIYGTNFDVLPGKDHPYGFWIMIGSMLALAGYMVHISRKKGWF